MTMRLSIITLAGTARTVVAVGTVREASMLVAMAFIGPRSGVRFSSPKSSVEGVAFGAWAGIGAVFGAGSAFFASAAGAALAAGAGSVARAWAAARGAPWPLAAGAAAEAAAAGAGCAAGAAGAVF